MKTQRSYEGYGQKKMNCKHCGKEMILVRLDSQDGGWLCPDSIKTLDRSIWPDARYIGGQSIYETDGKDPLLYGDAPGDYKNELG